MSQGFEDIETALAGLKPAPARPLPAARPLPKPFRRPGWLAAAAVFLGALLTGWWTGRPAPWTEGRALSVPAGESLALTLQDGSRLTLSGGAEAVLGPGRGRGEVLSLRRGVLRCEVVHAAGEFRISTPLGDVVDRGTEFTLDVQPMGQEEVMTKNQKRGVGAAVVTVGVLVGWVEFRQGASEAAVPVQAGQTLVVETGSAPVVIPVAVETPAPAGGLAVEASLDARNALVTVTWDAPDYAPDTLLDVSVFRASEHLQPLRLEAKEATVKERLLKIQLRRDALEVPGRYLARVTYDPVRQFPDTPRHPAASAEAVFYERPDPEDAAARRLGEIDAKLATGQPDRTGQEGIDDETRRRVEATANVCASHLREIGFAMSLFERSHARYPDMLDALVDSNNLSSTVIACPCRAGGKYAYLPVSPATRNLILDPSAWIWVHEDAPNALGKRVVLFLDEHMAVMDEKLFQERLAAQLGVAR